MKSELRKETEKMKTNEMIIKEVTNVFEDLNNITTLSHDSDVVKKFIVIYGNIILRIVELTYVCDNISGFKGEINIYQIEELKNNNPFVC